MWFVLRYLRLQYILENHSIFHLFMKDLKNVSTIKLLSVLNEMRFVSYLFKTGRSNLKSNSLLLFRIIRLLIFLSTVGIPWYLWNKFVTTMINITRMFSWNNLLFIVLLILVILSQFNAESERCGLFIITMRGILSKVDLNEFVFYLVVQIAS